jgi:hypothetical protein
MLLNPSFFYFWHCTGWLILPLAVCPPFFVIGNRLAAQRLPTVRKKLAKQNINHKSNIFDNLF